MYSVQWILLLNLENPFCLESDSFTTLSLHSDKILKPKQKQWEVNEPDLSWQQIDGGAARAVILEHLYHLERHKGLQSFGKFEWRKVSHRRAESKISVENVLMIWFWLEPSSHSALTSSQCWLI